MPPQSHCHIIFNAYTDKDTSSLSCLNEYLDVDNDGYSYANSLHALIASHRSQDGVWLNVSVRDKNIKLYKLS